MKINYNKYVWEGWTVQSFVDELELSVQMIMNNRSHVKPFKTRVEVKKWCMDNQPYYKKYIPDVVDHFCRQYGIAA